MPEVDAEDIVVAFRVPELPGTRHPAEGTQGTFRKSEKSN